MTTLNTLQKAIEKRAIEKLDAKLTNLEYYLDNLTLQEFEQEFSKNSISKSHSMKTCLSGRWENFGKMRDRVKMKLLPDYIQSETKIHLQDVEQAKIPGMFNDGPVAQKGPKPVETAPTPFDVKKYIDEQMEAYEIESKKRIAAAFAKSQIEIQEQVTNSVNDSVANTRKAVAELHFQNKKAFDIIDGRMRKANLLMTDITNKLKSDIEILETEVKSGFLNRLFHKTPKA